MKKYVILTVLIVIFLALAGCAHETENIKRKAAISPTETFIENELLTSKGLIRTDLKKQKDTYLSESTGLWMLHLVAVKDEKRFQQQVMTVKQNFLQQNIVIWRIEDKKLADVNALIDDFRIIYALYQASKLFNNKQYEELADRMSEQLISRQRVDGIFVDYMDSHTFEKAQELTISYIDTATLQWLKRHSKLSADVYQKQLTILKGALQPEGYYAKRYDIITQTYVVENELHLIDQLYTAYHSALAGIDTTSFTQWLEQVYQRDEKLYGQYTTTQQPLVNYESPAVYALSVLYFKEINEEEQAKIMYQQLLKLRSPIENKGYVDDNNNTHSFDNLLPLLVEGIYADEEVK